MKSNRHQQVASADCFYCYLSSNHAASYPNVQQPYLHRIDCCSLLCQLFFAHCSCSGKKGEFRCGSYCLANCRNSDCSDSHVLLNCSLIHRCHGTLQSLTCYDDYPGSNWRCWTNCSRLLRYNDVYYSLTHDRVSCSCRSNHCGLSFESAKNGQSDLSAVNASYWHSCFHNR